MDNATDDLGLAPRFLVQRPLGTGARSQVFEVWDPIQDVRRALKLAGSRGQLRRFQTEFRLLSELRHPNVVRAYDFGLTAHGLPYYTLELIEGTAFGSFEHGGDPEVVAIAALQALDALATLHARGWVHHDVSPENLLVAGKATAMLVRLIDFGLVAPVGKPSKAAGTLPYMAPEVARGAEIDGRADLYSLGVVLYEALLPHDAARTVEDIARQFVHKPPAPSRVNPLIPQGLSDFIMRLLEPEPAARFSDAHAAAEELAGSSGMRLGRGPPRATAERILRGGAVSHRVGTLRRVRKLAASVRDEGRGRVCIVEGNIGVGKTPFLREVGVHLCLDGFRLAHLRTTMEPGAPVGRLLRAAQGLDPDAIAEVTPEWIPWERRGAGYNAAAFVGRLGQLLAQAFAGAPTALLIDDLHRAEQVALEVLRSLGQELGAVPLLLICAGDPRTDGIELRDVMGPDVEVLQLAPLTASEVARLATHRLHGLTLPRPALGRLVTDSEGMPSLVERTLARLLVERTIERRGAQFVFTGGRYQAVRHGDPEQLSDRIAQVSGEQRPVLWAAAVLGQRLDAEAVAEVAGLEVERTAGILAELARIEILAPGEASEGPVYLFARRHLLSVVYQQIPPEERRRLHDRAAALFARRPRCGRRQEEYVEHVLKGSDDELAVRAAIEAGDRAALVYADRRAIEYFARAYARLRGVDDPRSAPVALRLGKLFERTGELERAATWYQAALGAAPISHAKLHVEANLGLAGVALVRGLPADAERHAERALELIARVPEPLYEAAALRLQALVAKRRGDSGQAAALLQRAHAELQRLGNESALVEVLLDMARLAQQRGELVQAVRHARRALQKARANKDPSSLAEASTVLARGLVRAGRVRSARAALYEGLRGVRASGDRLREAAVLRELGNLRLREGELEVALDRYGKSLELVRTARARVSESACLADIGCVRALLGDFRAALTALGAALDIADGSGDVRASVYALVQLGHVHAWLGDYAAAARVLDDAIGMPVTSEDPVLGGEARAVKAWVDACAGATEEAARFLAELERWSRPLEDPADEGLVLLYAARCAVVLGQIERATTLVERLEVLVDGGALEHLRPSLLLTKAQVALRRGEGGRAVTLLRAAVERAAARRMRPAEIEGRWQLGCLLAGTDVGAEELTRAMELLRDTVSEMPEASVRVLLRSPLATSLREAFGAEQRRLGSRVAVR